MPENSGNNISYFIRPYAHDSVEELNEAIRSFFQKKRIFSVASIDSLIFGLKEDAVKGKKFYNACLDLVEQEAPEENSYRSDLVRELYRVLTGDYGKGYVVGEFLQRITDLYERFVPEEQRRVDQRPQKTMEDFIREREIERQETLRRVRAEREERKAQEAEQERQARQREILEEGQQDISLLFPLGIRRRPSPESSDRSSSSDSERSR